MDGTVVKELYASNKKLNEKLNQLEINIDKKILELSQNQKVLFDLLNDVKKQNETIISMIRIDESNTEYMLNIKKIDKNIKKFINIMDSSPESSVGVSNVCDSANNSGLINELISFT